MYGIDLDTPFVIPCQLGKKQTVVHSLVDTGATGGNFIDEKTAQQICELEGIAPIALVKPKALRGFDGRPAPSITHAIFPRLHVQDHAEDLSPLLITKLGHHPIIISKV